MDESELERIEERAASAFAVLPSPWSAYLETRAGIGGGSFIGGGSGSEDNEMYVSLHIGGKELLSPSVQLDTVLEFIASASEDIVKLVAEVRRLRK